ncbi:cell envelope integrity protein TolA [Psychrobacter sp. ASPA161_6]|uniref:cell envelope integrity protein TolA n=1 Tax=Psychrobacter sp. ASPA161_6 TaxID=3160962 RepID=UPI003F8039E0
MSLNNTHRLRNISTWLLLVSFFLPFSYSFAGASLESNNLKNGFMDQKALFAAITTKKHGLSNESNNPRESYENNVTTAILEKIKRNITLPTSTPESTTTLYFKLDEKGNVLSVKAQGANPAVNQAVEKAALSASPLPIGLNKPESFKDLIIKINVTNNNLTEPTKNNVITAILEKIKRNITLPAATQGSAVTLYLRLDKKGNVLSIKTQGSNVIVNRAVKRAALSASPLPIGLNKPESFRDLVIKINVQ